MEWFQEQLGALRGLEVGIDQVELEGEGPPIRG